MSALARRLALVVALLAGVASAGAAWDGTHVIRMQPADLPFGRDE